MNGEKYSFIVIKFWGKIITDRNKVLRFVDMSDLIWFARADPAKTISQQNQGHYLNQKTLCPQGVARAGISPMSP